MTCRRRRASVWKSWPEARKRPSDDAAQILSEPLTYAGRIDAMAFLAGYGAALDAEPYNGTALRSAVARRQPEAAWLDHGADIKRRARVGGARRHAPACGRRIGR